MFSEVMRMPDKNYIMYKCLECGTEFIIPKEYVDHNDNYLTCPKHGRHHRIKVIDANDDLSDCMSARKYRRNGRGALVQE